ncbi:MAG: hypothetical protein JRJ09_13880 [Deltaproteobacteria bacterium]|nr:hypothetical protein [Deltaproteobacteria bacterium]MBW2049598.1 hypothetical protein [Deltaproteobacteria bacterium]MBW2112024.1 hypothetical protein [Deltaproteobacteria bacterium]MBW2352005.1 hypothetical protein [Deltaproteobacteria bacterium]HDZ90372.1 hypothetical protein [Deltaproteobacteria bacterium]
MILDKTSLSDPVEKKIAWARGCHENFGEALLKEERISRLVLDLKAAVYTSRREMALTGVVDICRRCDREEGGSCCGAGLENRYDGWMLLINLLMGVRLPETRAGEKDCFFLSKNGCILTARHVICINYLCERITRLIEPGAIRAMRDMEGREINILFFLHEEMKRVLRRWTRP